MYFIYSSVYMSIPVSQFIPPIYTMEYYLVIKKNEIMPFAATWMDLEIVILSEVERQISYDITYVWNLKKMVQMNLFTKQK